MDNAQQIKLIASEAVDVMESVSNAAEEFANRSKASSGHAQLASINAFTDTNAVDNMCEISRSIQAGYRDLQNEPAIARVLYHDGVDSKILYISRKSALNLGGDIALASYDSPLGHLASLQVGDETTLNIGGKSVLLEVLETLTLKPQKSTNGWDSSFSIFTSEDEECRTYEPSLRRLFEEEKDLSDTSFLDSLLNGGDSSTDFTMGVKHQVRTAMSLRDQPVLDKFQSEIFRLPLDSQLIILGPPGTGKTTTLIKRLGQKLNVEYLDHDEQTKIKNSKGGEAQHKTSWIMFTPTDLLKHYLKEAFAKEQVPASSEQIKTWGSYSNYLGRNVLSILQSTGSGGFVKKDDSYLNSKACSNLPKFYEEFIDFHKTAVTKELLASVELLNKLESSDLRSIQSALQSVAKYLEQGKLIAFYENLDKFQDDIQLLLKKQKDSSESLLRGVLAYQVNTDKGFISDLIAMINDWKKNKLSELIIDDEDDEDDEDEKIVTPQQQAFSEYKKAINALARAKYLKRSLPKGGLPNTIIQWLGTRLPEADKLQNLGFLAIKMRELRKFKSAELKYLKNISKHYRTFRKSEEVLQTWFDNLPTKPNHIEQSELDVIILSKLKIARELLNENFVRQKVELSSYNQLQLINETFRNQVLVDEATDFSPIQLACMESLTTLLLGSFFACGDFNQRITLLGTKSVEQLSWVSAKLRSEPINIVYRQSKCLNEFAKALLQEMGGNVEYSGELPDKSNHQGVSPVLLENEHNIRKLVRWLKDRISEVEQTADTLPSIAILVNHEDEVKPLAEVLTEELEDLNIRAVACSDGQSLGEGNDVRVFDVQHIKGLEFEAVFFVGVDVLADTQPELFDKYLYVGATRAATFLGITCEGSTPKLIDKLRTSFQENWG
ncbi:ATP-binding domain-containing protein [Shewanella algae]|uniref:ATP-binding domain-containing protein n=1 Tax=Shewanella algae TaxID=38313 RepID=UPI001AAC9EF8|nr:ATP-binding domain-containing protein [Shewanella algae]MBO2550481.1 ATP-binding domain-containing protein [Shewanella algae]